jgi:Protein of unknown function (DUF2637)
MVDGGHGDVVVRQRCSRRDGRTRRRACTRGWRRTSYPPVVLLAATHSVALLVRTRAGGFTYWCALLMTVALALCAFVLSFDALRSLAITLGLPGSIAWLWPCAIDVAIAQATLCLLSLSHREATAESVADVSSHPGDSSESNRPPRHLASPDANGATKVRSATSVQTAFGLEKQSVVSREDPAAIQRWTPIAESPVQEGITSKDPVLVATILTQREAGVAPSTIGRAIKVHHTTVSRILSAAEELASM